jgi:hypothetical protein
MKALVGVASLFLAHVWLTGAPAAVVPAPVVFENVAEGAGIQTSLKHQPRR